MRSNLMSGLGAAAMLLAVSPAHARLGAMATAIPAEQTQAHAQGRAVAMPDHVRHEMVLPNGGTVHQFANAAGEVFAVTWSGPGKPDLRTLLGGHFARLEEAGQATHALRRPAQVNRDDIMIQTGGHMGYFWGVAYLPALAPAGFDVAGLN